MKKYFFQFFISKFKNAHFWGTPNFLYNFFLSLSFWNNRDTNVLLVSIFENAWKKVINFQKWPKWQFWWLLTFFCAFSKIPNKITIVCLLFLKLNQSQNIKKKFCLGVFLQKPKSHFFGGQNKIVLKLKFQICISAFVLYCKRKIHTNLHKKYWYLSPLEFFENENFDMRAPARSEILDLDF